MADLSILNPGTPFSKKAFELIEFYRNNPVIAAEDLLNVDLDTVQKTLLEDMWFKPYVLITASRGSGKSFLLSVITPLYAMLYPGKRVLIMSPSFRQSKGVFSELSNRYQEAPILREVTIKKPVTGADNCYLHFRAPSNRFGSRVEAYPLGTGDKIRGLRGHLIVVDEFAQVPEEIFEMVIRPMGATTNNPMANVRRLKRLRDNLEKGVLTQEEYDFELDGHEVNKIICVSSAYYQFNHMYKRIQAYEEEIAKGSDKYAVHYVSYHDMSEGFLDSDNVEEAKATMSRIEFNLEYEAIWESDSDGAFKASLIESCKDSGNFVKERADSGKEYILGIDPARSSDAFAVVVIERGNPSYVVSAFEATGEKFPKMAGKIFDFCDDFNVSLAMMDAGSGGGGVALKDLLANEQMFSGRLILDMDDEEYKDTPGRKILRMHVPKPDTIAEMNFAAINLLERGLLKFPRGPKEYSKSLENVSDTITKMLKQMLLVTITPAGKSGAAHFDIPSTGKGSRRKDLYSAFILAAKGLYDTLNVKRVVSYTPMGIIKPRKPIIGPPSISSISNIKGR